jgi:REP element-mobilizing transposase RayT
MPSLQLAFKEFESEKRKEFGGALIRGNPRERRPISVKRPVHLVLRSSLAVGEKSFLKGKRRSRIKSLIDRAANVSGVKVYRLANAGNHLHLIVLPRSRAAFNAFIRAITGLIARLTLGAERGKSKGVKFWDARPFTRILEWGRDYATACRYLMRNTLEALGFIEYQPRKRRSYPRIKEPD